MLFVMLSVKYEASFVDSSSLGARGGIQTLDFTFKSQVLDHCATGSQRLKCQGDQKIRKNCPIFQNVAKTVVWLSVVVVSVVVPWCGGSGKSYRYSYSAKAFDLIAHAPNATIS